MAGTTGVQGNLALGIGAESPERSEDLQRKARPEGERPHGDGAVVFVQLRVDV